MGSSDSNRASNNSFSWEGGELNTRPISAQGLNSGMRSDMQAAYLRGPTQQNYVGLGDDTRTAMSNLTGAARDNRGLLSSAIGYNQGVVNSGGFTDSMMNARNGLNSLAGNYNGILSTGGLTDDMRTAQIGMGRAAGQYQDIISTGGYTDAMMGAQRGLEGLRDQYQGIASGDGLNPMLRGVAGDAGNISNSFMDIANSGGLTPEQRQAMSGVQSTRARYDDMYTRGAAGNPELGNIIRQTNDNTYADMMASLGSTGGIGSSLHSKELGGALADNESRLRYQDYGDSFARQGNALAGAMGADTSLFGMGQTGAGNTQSALSGALGAQGLISGVGQFGANNVNSALAGVNATNAGIFGMGQQGIGNVNNALAGYQGALSGQNAIGQQGMSNVQGALSGLQGINTGVFNMDQAGRTNAGNAAGQLSSLYDASMTPERMAVAEQGMLDADRLQQAQFDPVTNHIANWQGLLGANAAGPQPAGLMDYLKLIGGTAAAIF